LISAGIRHADVVLGHPSALPVGDEIYGYPARWPDAFSPDPAELNDLRMLCETVRDSFTLQWNAALAELDPSATPSTDAFTETGDVLLLNYPAELHDEDRAGLLPPHIFLGSAVREEATDDEVSAWLAESPDRIVYVSFGSFLSVRSDVLARVVEALAPLDIRVALASGSTEISDLGVLPESWLVRAFLPQVTLLKQSALAVSHGGNNSVTEAMTSAVPLLLLPFSTDQFAGAAALDLAGFGLTLDPNTASVDELRAAAVQLLNLAVEPRTRLTELGVSLQDGAGPLRALASSRAEVAHTSMA
jgi:zeaxanthin glucosyltransferase